VKLRVKLLPETKVVVPRVLVSNELFDRHPFFQVQVLVDVSDHDPVVLPPRIPFATRTDFGRTPWAWYRPSAAFVATFRQRRVRAAIFSWGELFSRDALRRRRGRTAIDGSVPQKDAVETQQPVAAHKVKYPIDRDVPERSRMTKRRPDLDILKQHLQQRWRCPSGSRCRSRCRSRSRSRRRRIRPGTPILPPLPGACRTVETEDWDGVVVVVAMRVSRIPRPRRTSLAP